MKWDHVERHWRQLRGKVRTRWGRLTDRDLDVIAGKRAQLVGTLQARYGTSPAAAETQIEEWSRRIDDDPRTVGKPH